MTPTSPLTWASRTNLADKAGLSCLRLRTLFLLEAGVVLGTVIAEVRRCWCKAEARQQIGADAQDDFEKEWSVGRRKMVCSWEGYGVVEDEGTIIIYGPCRSKSPTTSDTRDCRVHRGSDLEFSCNETRRRQCRTIRCSQGRVATRNAVAWKRELRFGEHTAVD